MPNSAERGRRSGKLDLDGEVQAEGDIAPNRLHPVFLSTRCIWGDLRNMKSHSRQIRSAKRAAPVPAERRTASAGHRTKERRATKRGEGTMQPEARSGQMDAVQAHPLAELLQCPPETGNLLNGAAQCVNLDVGDIVFRQGGPCHGLYVVISGQFLRKTERLETRLTLGPARVGELVELAAALEIGRASCR